ncbi:hypothetical protein [Herbihabitans rhizosphaerae]|nr:hypothetical protein [Herbihabitans rhizosphaerae]
MFLPECEELGGQRPRQGLEPGLRDGLLGDRLAPVRRRVVVPG